MASNKNMNADGQTGSSKIDVNPPKSGNAAIGLNFDWVAGSSGSREGAMYGGGSNKGVEYPRANSVHGVDKEMNAGNKDYQGGNNGGVGNEDLIAGEIGRDKVNVQGTSGAREQMLKYGGEDRPKGKIAGKGAGSNPAINESDVFFSGNKVFDKNFVLDGTGQEKKAYQRSLRGYNKKASPAD